MLDRMVGSQTSDLKKKETVDKEKHLIRSKYADTDLLIYYGLVKLFNLK